MSPESSSSVATSSKSTISSSLIDYNDYRTCTSSRRSPTFLTSNSPMIRSYSSTKANLFSDSIKSYKIKDLNRFINTKPCHHDYTSFSRPLLMESKYYNKKKSVQVLPSSTISKYQSNCRASSLPSSTYMSKTIDSKNLDGNANYRFSDSHDSSLALVEKKLNLLRARSGSDLGIKKYSTEYTNGYNANDLNKKNIDEKKECLGTSTYRKKYDKFINDENNSDTCNKWSGLRNVGNTCYMNSILQCLSCTKLLKEYVISKAYIKDVNEDGMLIDAFHNLLSRMWSQTSGAVDVSAFKEIFQRLAPQFAGYDQHDAQEFLRFLVDKLHVDVNRVHAKPRNLPEVNDKLPDNSQASEHWRRYLMSENSYILELFGGQLKSTLQCLVCKNKSVTFEIFWDLSLPLPSYTSYNSSVSITDILRNFTLEEILDNREKPRCSQCKIEQRMSKSYSFQKLPKYLVLHLKRFQTTSSYRKLSTVVQFPMTGLDMSPFLAKAVISSPRTYNLYAVSNHMGTPFTGHYTANCKHPNCGDWYSCNDSSVTKITPPIASKLVSADSYILFYEAVDS